jgi:hypothetical protein
MSDDGKNGVVENVSGEDQQVAQQSEVLTSLTDTASSAHPASDSAACQTLRRNLQKA